MSTDYAPSQKILAKDLLDGRLDQFSIRELPGGILVAISEAFEEEWDAWRAITEQHEDEFYADILKFAAGEPNGIRQGTIGEGRRALIGKKLIADDPGLVASERRAELMQKINTIYDRDYAVHDTPPF